jgi:hypothetical protein
MFSPLWRKPEMVANRRSMVAARTAPIDIRPTALFSITTSVPLPRTALRRALRVFAPDAREFCRALAILASRSDARIRTPDRSPKQAYA